MIYIRVQQHALKVSQDFRHVEIEAVGFLCVKLDSIFNMIYEVNVVSALLKHVFAQAAGQEVVPIVVKVE